jgi:hypothetical protein
MDIERTHLATVVTPTTISCVERHDEAMRPSPIRHRYHYVLFRGIHSCVRISEGEQC